MIARVALLTALAAGSLTSCGTPDTCPGPPNIVAWNFTPDCSARDPLCGFTATRGEASIVPLHHPAERGLRLAPGTTVSARIGAFTGRAMFPFRLEVTTRCDDGTSLAAHLVVGPSGASDAATSRSFPEVMIPWEPGWATVRVSLGETDGMSPLQELVLTTRGAGACHVDNISLSQPVHDFKCD